MVLLPLAAALALAIPSRAAEDPAPAKRLFFVLLETGGNREPLPQAERERMQQEHVDNLGRLHREGRNLLAGPLGDGGKMRGIAVLDLPDEEALKEEFAGDPFVAHDYLRLRAARFEMTTGAPGKPEEPVELGRYLLALVHPDGEPDAEEGRRLFADLERRLRDADSDRLLAIAGPTGGDDDLLGVLLFRTDDRTVVQRRIDEAVGEDAPVTVKLYTQLLAKGILDPAAADKADGDGGTGKAEAAGGGG